MDPVGRDWRAGLAVGAGLAVPQPHPRPHPPGHPEVKAAMPVAEPRNQHSLLSVRSREEPGTSHESLSAAPSLVMVEEEASSNFLCLHEPPLASAAFAASPARRQPSPSAEFI